jgi:hypothetical protein
VGNYEECELEQSWYIPVYKAVWSDGVPDASWHCADLSGKPYYATEAEAEAMLVKFRELWGSEERVGRTIVTAVVREVKTTKRTLLQ